MTLFRNIFWLSARVGMGFVFRFVYLVLIVKLLTTAEYGIVSSVGAWAMGIVSIFSFGMGTTITRLVPMHDKKNKINKIKGIIWLAIKFGLVMSAIISIGLIAASYLHMLPEIMGFAFLVAIGVFLYFPFNFLANAIYGLQKMALLTTVDTLLNVLKIVFGLTLFYVGFGYVGVIYGLFLSLFLMVIAKLYILKRYIGRKGSDLKNIVSHSISAYATDLFNTVSSQGRIIISNFLLDISSIGLMSFALGISAYAGTIPSIITGAVFPIASRGDNPKKVIKTGLILTILVSIPIILIVALFAKPIVVIIAKAAYLPIANFLIFFVSAELLYSITNMILSQLYAVGKHLTTRKIYSLGIPMSMLLNFFFIKTFGIIGLPFSYMIYSGTMLVLGSISLRRYLNGQK